MGAVYTATEYLGFSLGLFLGGAVLSVVVCLGLVRKLAVKYRNFGLSLLPILGMLLAFVALGNLVIPVLNTAGDLIPGDYTVRTAAGEISDITPAAHRALFWRNGRLLGGQVVTVDGVEYYGIADGLLAEGMCVELRYAPFDSNVILGWQETTAERAEQVRAEALLEEQAAPEKAPPKEVPEAAKRLGTWMVRIGFAGFMVGLGLTTCFHWKILDYLLRKDAAVTGEILPNRLALFLNLVPMSCIALMGVGMSVGSGEGHALFVLALGCGGMTAVIVGESFTKLTISGEILTIRRCGKQRQYHLSDVRGVYWRPCRGITGKAMVLVLNDGRTHWFHMDYLTGVRSVYNEISGYLEKTQSR